MPDECPYKEHCSEHDDNTATLNRHKGFWIVIFVVMMAAISSGWSFLERIDDSVQVMAESTTKMDKVFTGYMAANTQKLTYIDRMIGGCNRTDVDYEMRLRELEHPQ